jgi:hypothetical protein
MQRVLVRTYNIRKVDIDAIRGKKTYVLNFLGQLRGVSLQQTQQLDILFHKIDLNNRLKPFTTYLNSKFQCSTMDLNNRLKPQTMQVWSLGCLHEL